MQPLTSLFHSYSFSDKNNAPCKMFPILLLKGYRKCYISCKKYFIGMIQLKDLRLESYPGSLELGLI